MRNAFKIYTSLTEGFLFDNEALLRLCSKKLPIEAPTYGDLNHLASQAMSGITCGIRFPGQLNSSMRKNLVNLVPFPNLHFFMVSHAPLTQAKSVDYKAMTVWEVSRQMLEAGNVMCSSDIRHGRFLTASAIYRGKVSAKEVD